MFGLKSAGKSRSFLSGPREHGVSLANSEAVSTDLTVSLTLPNRQPISERYTRFPIGCSYLDNCLCQSQRHGKRWSKQSIRDLTGCSYLGSFVLAEPQRQTLPTHSGYKGSQTGCNRSGTTDPKALQRAAQKVPDFDKKRRRSSSSRMQ